MRLNPMQAGTRSLLVQALIWEGWPDKADAEFKVLGELTPADKRAELDRWYKDEQARAKP